ncbi:MAG: hypothetical protein R3209_03020 [Salinimicrobium sediminis]|nr:hypothetical protein [Salinimicrobium sediminis]
MKSLLLGNTDAGSNIFISRVNKAFIEELPGIFIYTISDTPKQTSKTMTNFDRVCINHIEILVPEISESQTIQDEADIIAGQVEDILLPNMFLQYPPPPANSYAVPTPPAAGPKIVNSIQVTDTQMARVDDTLEDVYGITLEITTEYYYCRATLQELQDFLRFGHDYKIGDETQENLTEIPVSP